MFIKESYQNIYLNTSQVFQLTWVHLTVLTYSIVKILAINFKANWGMSVLLRWAVPLAISNHSVVVA